HVTGVQTCALPILSEASQRNGRSFGVAVRKNHQQLGVRRRPGAQGCADRRFSWMKTASLHGRTCSVSAQPCIPASQPRTYTPAQKVCTNNIDNRKQKREPFGSPSQSSANYQRWLSARCCSSGSVCMRVAISL